MHKIELKRNDKCLCGSGLKFKKCCGVLGNIEYYEVTDLDFIFVEEFNSTINLRNKSNVYLKTYDAYIKLKNVCEEYKEKIIGKKNLNQDIIYKYIFKKVYSKDSVEETQLFLNGIKEIGDVTDMSFEVANDNLETSIIMINNLKQYVIPEELYLKQEQQKLKNELIKNNINLIYEEK